MKANPIPLSSLDAADAAGHLAEILREADPPLKTALLMAPQMRPVLRYLKRRLPEVQWRTMRLPSPYEAQAHLSLADGEVDAVVSLDNLSLQPRDSRPLWFREMVRVARCEVLVAEPLGTDLQRVIEDSLARYYRGIMGTDHPELAAHLAFGLPDPEEVFHWIEHGEDADIFYAGDVIAYQEMAEHVIRSAFSGKIAALLSHITKHMLFDIKRTGLELETVPMRRHRRLYLHLTRAWFTWHT